MLNIWFEHVAWFELSLYSASLPSQTLLYDVGPHGANFIMLGNTGEMCRLISDAFYLH